MRFLWRWLKRVLATLFVVVLALLAPVAWADVNCRGEGPVTSRQLVRQLSEQLQFEVVPVLHGLQGRLAAQG
jgi:hypothetical protein